MADRQAEFAEVYRRDRHRWVRIAYAVSGHRRNAEDAVAEAVARVWPRFRAGRVDDLSLYMRRAVVNEALSEGRRRGAAARASGRAQPVTPRAAVDEVVEDQWLVVDGLMRLPAGQRAVIALRFLDDLSEAATAATLDLSVGTVKSRAHRGLQALRALLEEVASDG